MRCTLEPKTIARSRIKILKNNRLIFDYKTIYSCKPISAGIVRMSRVADLSEGLDLFEPHCLEDAGGVEGDAERINNLCWLGSSSKRCVRRTKNLVFPSRELAYAMDGAIEAAERGQGRARGGWRPMADAQGRQLATHDGVRGRRPPRPMSRLAASCCRWCGRLRADASPDRPCHGVFNNFGGGQRITMSSELAMAADDAVSDALMEQSRWLG